MPGCRGIQKTRHPAGPGHRAQSYGQFIDLYSGKSPTQYERRIVLQAYQYYWLTEI